MPAIQTTYTDNIAAGYPGLVVDMGQANSISRLVEDAAGIGFGIAVFQGVADRGITATPGTLFQGISIADKSLVLLAPTGTITGTVDTYPQRATAGLQQKGTIWVNAGGAVAAGAPAYVTSGGIWTSTSTNNTAIPNAYFEKTTTAAGLTIVRLR